jgi:hypothetical protein
MNAAGSAYHEHLAANRTGKRSVVARPVFTGGIIGRIAVEIACCHPLPRLVFELGDRTDVEYQVNPTLQFRRPVIVSLDRSTCKQNLANTGPNDPGEWVTRRPPRGTPRRTVLEPPANTVMITPSPRRFRRDPEPSSRWRPTHQRRAGLGVWAAGRSRQARSAIKAWKR